MKWVVRKQSDWCRYQDIDQAHDLTQEIFEELYSSIQNGSVNIDEINNLTAFCLKRLRFRYIDKLRRDKTYGRIIEELFRRGDIGYENQNEDDELSQNIMVQTTSSHEDEVITKIAWEKCIKFLKDKSPKNFHYLLQYFELKDPVTGAATSTINRLANLLNIKANTLRPILAAAQHELGDCLDKQLNPNLQ